MRGASARGPRCSRDDVSYPSPSRILFDSPLLTVGRFRCEPDHPLWQEENHITGGHNIVFPRTPVRIHHAGFDPVLTCANHVIFYNQGQVYRRSLVSPAGDHCDWFVVRPQVLAASMREYEPAVDERPERPFRFTHAPSDARCHLLQRALMRLLENGDPRDALQIEEGFLNVLQRVIAGAFRFGARSRPIPRRSRTARAHRECVEAAKSLLASHLGEPLSLERIAAAAGTSVFHLCRVFRGQTGQTIHRYLTRLRLRTALDRVLDGNLGLMDLALDLGFASHSHFTGAFREEFGISPSRLRRTAPAALLLELSKNPEVSTVARRYA